jgi:hypothetical protein
MIKMAFYSMLSLIVALSGEAASAAQNRLPAS